MPAAGGKAAGRSVAPWGVGGTAPRSDRCNETSTWVGLQVSEAIKYCQIVNIPMSVVSDSPGELVTSLGEKAKRSSRRLVTIRRPERDVRAPSLAQQPERDVPADAAGIEQSRQIVDTRDGQPVDPDHDSPATSPRLGRGTARLHLDHTHCRGCASPDVDPQPLRQRAPGRRRCRSGPRRTRPCCSTCVSTCSAVLAATEKQMPCAPMITAVLMPITSPARVDQRPAGVAGIERRIGLDHVADQAPVLRPQPATDGADDAGRHRRLEAERVADGDGDLAAASRFLELPSRATGSGRWSRRAARRCRCRDRGRGCAR